MKESTKKWIAFTFATVVLVIVGIWGNVWIGFGLLAIVYAFFIGDWIKRKWK